MSEVWTAGGLPCGAERPVVRARVHGLERLDDASARGRAEREPERAAEGAAPVAAREPVVGRQRERGERAKRERDAAAIDVLVDAALADARERGGDVGGSAGTRRECRWQDEALLPVLRMQDACIVERDVAERVVVAPQPHEAEQAGLEVVELIVAAGRSAAELEVARAVPLARVEPEAAEQYAVARIGVLRESRLVLVPRVLEPAELGERAHGERVSVPDRPVGRDLPRVRVEEAARAAAPFRMERRQPVRIPLARGPHRVAGLDAREV